MYYRSYNNIPYLYISGLLLIHADEICWYMKKIYQVLFFSIQYLVTLFGPMCAMNAFLNSSGGMCVEVCKTKSKVIWVKEYGHMLFSAIISVVLTAIQEPWNVMLCNLAKFSDVLKEHASIFKVEQF